MTTKWKCWKVCPGQALWTHQNTTHICQATKNTYFNATSDLSFTGHSHSLSFSLRQKKYFNQFQLSSFYSVEPLEMHHVILEEVSHINNTKTHTTTTTHTTHCSPTSTAATRPAHHVTASLKNEFAYKYRHRATHTYVIMTIQHHYETSVATECHRHLKWSWMKWIKKEIQKSLFSRGKMQFVSEGVELYIGLGSVFLMVEQRIEDIKKWISPKLPETTIQWQCRMRCSGRMGNINSSKMGKNYIVLNHKHSDWSITVEIVTIWRPTSDDTQHNTG